MVARRGYWTAAVTHYGQEQRAAHHVERQGFQFYLPQIGRITAKGTERREYLFPGYLFVRITAQWRRLCSTRGIARLLMCGESPSLMPEWEVYKMQEREDESGIIRLPDPYEIGTRIRIRAGALSGIDAIVTGMPAATRLRILADIFGRKVQFDIDRAMVEAA